MTRARPIRHYQRPAQIEHHLKTANMFGNTGNAVVQYQECAALLDTVMYDLFKTTERFHVVVDRHGPLYHVEVMDIISKLELIMEKVNTCTT